MKELSDTIGVELSFPNSFLEKGHFQERDLILVDKIPLAFHIQTDNGKRLNNKKYINLINLNKINQINLKKKIEKNVNFFSKPQSSLSKKLKKNTLYKVCNIIKKNI